MGLSEDDGSLEAVLACGEDVTAIIAALEDLGDSAHAW